MKIFVTGANGQLGHDAVNELARRGHAVIGSDLTPVYGGAADGSAVAALPYEPLDITDASAVSAVLARLRPEAVIHCAAWTAVDAAEEAENRARVYAVNVSGTQHIAEACCALGCKLMYLSTDYVFDGQGEAPWQPDCRAFAPLNYYGETKLGGEQAVRDTLAQHFIVRIAWVFGRSGKNFVKTMLRLGRTHDAVRVVNDQIGTPTYTFDLARLLADMIVTERYGCYHATNEGGYLSWYEFACEIFRLAGYAVKVVPVTTAAYGLSRAARPRNSRMDKSKLAENGFAPLPCWQDALARYLREWREDEP